MAPRSRGNGTNFDWLRKSCDISTCDLSPDGNPEKYGRPMKSAIDVHVLHVQAYSPNVHTVTNSVGQIRTSSHSRKTNTLRNIHAYIKGRGASYISIKK